MIDDEKEMNEFHIESNFISFYTNDIYIYGSSWIRNWWNRCVDQSYLCVCVSVKMTFSKYSFYIKF